MSDIAIAAIIRRRRELSGALLDLLAQATALEADIAALDRTLYLFDSTIIPEAIPALRFRPQPDWQLRGAVVRKVVDTLRIAKRPLATLELVKAVHGDAPTALHTKRVRKCLDRQRQRGTLQSLQVNGQLAWALARQP